MKKSMLALALAASMLSGCATIVGDTTTPVTVASEPAGATYEVRDSTGLVVHRGVTPSMVTLKTGAGYFRSAKYSVLLRKEGYGDQTVPLEGNVSGWYWGNFVFGGIIGMFVVDPLTGAMFKLPDATHATLSPLVSSAKP